MTDDFRKPKGGGNPKAPKKRRGKGWLLKRSRNGRSWHERKMRSPRYVPANPSRA